MPLKTSLRGAVSPFVVMDMLRIANERAAGGEDVIHLELGEPGVPVPAGVREAVRRLIDQSLPGYTDARGIPALRTRIAQFHGERYGLPVDASDVFITTGSSGAFVLAFLAAFDPGDRVALAEPGYPAYRNILRALGLIPVPLRAGPGSRYQPTVEHLASLDTPVDGLLVASPSNPTGSIMPKEAFAAMGRYCREAGIRLISDEIYHGVTYGQPGETARRHDPNAVVVNSFSKYFAMPGWRLGWMIAPADLRASVERLAQNLYISTSSMAQHAALAVFDCLDELDANVTMYAGNRTLLLDALPELGFAAIAESDGAFYLYIDVSDQTESSRDFCARLLNETGVAMTPGIDFDPEQGEGFIRLSYSAPTLQIEHAVERLRTWRKRKG